MPALSAVLLIFSFQFSLLFFHVGRQAAAAAVAYVVCPISDIGRCQKCGKYVPRARRTAQGKDVELVPTVKMKTKHPVEGYFGSKFRAICNRCGVMAAARPGNLWVIFAFFKNSVPKVFTVTPIGVVLFKCREMLPTGNRRNSALCTGPKKFAASQTVATPKSTTASFQQFADFIHIGSLSAEL